jgi:hypothetical protein
MKSATIGHYFFLISYNGNLRAPRGGSGENGSVYLWQINGSERFPIDLLNRGCVNAVSLGVSFCWRLRSVFGLRECGNFSAKYRRTYCSVVVLLPVYDSQIVLISLIDTTYSLLPSLS